MQKALKLGEFLEPRKAQDRREKRGEVAEVSEGEITWSSSLEATRRSLGFII